MVIMLYTYGAAVIGYMQRASAYYPACRCFGSFAVLKEGIDQKRVVTEGELEKPLGSSHLPVVVLSGWELPAETLQGLQLEKLRAFSGSPEAKENFYTYERPGH